MHAGCVRACIRVSTQGWSWAPHLCLSTHLAHLRKQLPGLAQLRLGQRFHIQAGLPPPNLSGLDAAHGAAGPAHAESEPPAAAARECKWVGL